MFDNNDGRIRGRRGQRIRAAFLQANPTCAHCEREGKITLAQEVDHIKPLAQGGTDTDDNKQSLCIAHHRAKTSAEAGDGNRFSPFPEWLKPAAGHLTIVYGPPGSGKSTYVAQQANPGDLVIDLDEIIAEQTGKPLYHGDDLGPALRHRNSLLGNLSREPRTAWLIVTGLKADRAWWERKLQPAATVLMDTPHLECIARVKADIRRPAHVKARHLTAVDEWFAAERGSAAQTKRKQEIGLDGWPIDE